MLKVIFGFGGILVVLAIVASLGKKQLQAINQMGQSTTRIPASAADGGSIDSMAGRAVGGSRLDGFAATAGAGAELPSAQQQIQGVQQSIRDRTSDALQQGAQRNQRAQP
jgi:hypothetical protein